MVEDPGKFSGQIGLAGAGLSGDDAVKPWPYIAAGTLAELGGLLAALGETCERFLDAILRDHSVPGHRACRSDRS